MEILFPLLEHLDAHAPTAPQEWQAWAITPVGGGANNLLYRAQHTDVGHDYAIKFTVRDARNRAGRECMALQALEEAGLTIAPRALWWSADRYHQPVVIQTWLAGETLTGPPETRADWDALLAHYCAIHSLTPERTAAQFAEAVINARDGASGRALVAQNVERLPRSAISPRLQHILSWFNAWQIPEWPAAPRTLCRVDPNWRNFIRRVSGEENTWASVDWENSGWGDPAFELADLMTHPEYRHVERRTWERLIDAYARQMQDETARLRIETYYTISLVWWCVRFARYLYEIPRGLDARLVAPPPDWRPTAEGKYAHYLTKTEAHTAQL